MTYHLRAGRPSDGRAPDGGAAGGPSDSGLADGGSYGVSVLFRECHAELVRLAVLLVGDRPSAEDVVQDVFARLCLRDRLPGGEGSLAYVRAAVLNGCRRLRGRRRAAKPVEARVQRLDRRRATASAAAGYRVPGRRSLVTPPQMIRPGGGDRRRDIRL
jgi:Sigma-70 region 2